MCVTIRSHQPAFIYHPLETMQAIPRARPPTFRLTVFVTTPTTSVAAVGTEAIAARCLSLLMSTCALIRRGRAGPQRRAFRALRHHVRLPRVLCVFTSRSCEDCQCLDRDSTLFSVSPCSPFCEHPAWEGDGHCDDNNNLCGCNWDGGDWYVLCGFRCSAQFALSRRRPDNSLACCLRVAAIPETTLCLSNTAQNAFAWTQVPSRHAVRAASGSYAVATQNQYSIERMETYTNIPQSKEALVGPYYSMCVTVSLRCVLYHVRVVVPSVRALFVRVNAHVIDCAVTILYPRGLVIAVDQIYLPLALRYLSTAPMRPYTDRNHSARSR